MSDEKSSDRQDRSNNDEHKKDGKQASDELGGRKGPDPTRYGDWEKNGRCIDF